jgi:DNA-binding winged helix-turn-helix (wHTH) protein
MAVQPDFQLGALEISPSRRLVEGPAGKVHVEPLIMQALLLLVDERGNVVTREELFSQCWGAATVGDDSLNRAVAKVRRIFEEVAPGEVEIETIPRTGYRLTAKQSPDEALGDAEPRRPSTVSRRILMVGGVVTAAAVGLSGSWWVSRLRSDRRFDALMKRSEEAVREGTLDDAELIRTLEEAVALNPASAKAWGLLAAVKGAIAEHADPGESARLVDESERAAGKALALDRREPNALFALAGIEGTIEGWASFDRKLRHILSIDPAHIGAISVLGVLTQGAGLNRESWTWNERAIALDPISPFFLSRRALKLWILGRTPEADRVLDRLRELWPKDSWIFLVRFQIYALTARPRAARAMLDSNAEMIGPPAAISMWRTALQGLETQTARDVRDAREAILAGAKLAPGLAAQGAMILGALGEVDAAFDVANGFLLSRGPILLREQKKGARLDLNDPGWKWTPWLFTPPVAVMRADPRFLPLCEGIGLADYWRVRGVKPDYQRITG